MKLIQKFNRIDSLKKRGLLLVSATVLANIFNLIFNVYLGRGLNIEGFALISLMSSMLTLADIPLSALSRTVTHVSAFQLGKHGASGIEFWKEARGRAFKIALLIAFVWTLLSIPAAKFFNLQNPIAMMALAPILLATVLLAIDGGFLRGNLRFGGLAAIAVVEAVLKLLFAIALVEFGFAEYSYFAIPLSIFASLAMVSFTTRKILDAKRPAIRKFKFPLKFFVSNIFTRIATASYLTADVILITHYLPAGQAGHYALLSLVGKMVFFAGSLFGQFILPIVSNAEGLGQKSEKVFLKLAALTALASLGAFLVVGIFGQVLLPLVFGERANAILPYIFAYSLGMAAFTVASNIVSFHQIKSKNLLPALSFVIAIAQVIALTMFHANIGQVALVMSLLGFVNLALALLIHYGNSKVAILTANFRDFFEIFTFKSRRPSYSGLRILIYNWRDTKHTWAGGAEMYIHELAKRWVRDGHSVTVFCGNDHKNERYEIYDGVEVIRRGGFYTVYLWALFYYILKFRRNYDIVVDSENGIPFFTPLFSTKPVVLLIHHVHQEIFREHLRFPFSTIAKFIEGKLMPFVYRNNKVITVSESSKSEIIKTGISKIDNISIVNPGIVVEKNYYKKTNYPTVTYLGRLKAYKNIDVAIKAFAQINKNLRSSRLWIIGEGENAGNLRDLVIQNNIIDKVTFFGKVDDKEKTRLLSESWVMVQPSSLEGWGITVLEANACKTPVVASNTKGLRDSIVDNKTGLLVKVRDIKRFTSTIRKVLKNQALRENLSKEAYIWSQKFSWDKSADVFMTHLVDTINAQGASRFTPSFGRNFLKRVATNKK